MSHSDTKNDPVIEESTLANPDADANKVDEKTLVVKLVTVIGIFSVMRLKDYFRIMVIPIFLFVKLPKLQK